MLKQQHASNDNIKVRLEQITPRKAAKLLQTNVSNRSVREAKVAEYAQLMAWGEWIDGVADIAVDANGDLQNGQHTLMAVVRSGCTITATVKRGMPPVGQDVTDAGRPRSIADQLSIDGIKNASSVAAIARIVMYWKEHGSLPAMSGRANVRATGGTQRVRVLNFARENAQMLEVEAALAKARTDANRILTVTQAGVCNIMFCDVNAEWGSAFMAQLFDETGNQSDQARALRKKLVALRDGNVPVRQVTTYAFAIKAFNAFMAHEPIKAFRMRPDEAFPHIVKPDWLDG